MEFVVRQMTGNADVALVRYDCACGCKPNAKYVRGTAEVGHEHCCCGNVHFVGPGARAALQAYLEDRRARNEDAGRGEYTLYETELDDPWGGKLPVAYGIPARHSHG